MFFCKRVFKCWLNVLHRLLYTPACQFAKNSSDLALKLPMYTMTVDGVKFKFLADSGAKYSTLRACEVIYSEIRQKNCVSVSNHLMREKCSLPLCIDNGVQSVNHSFLFFLFFSHVSG